MLLSSVAYDRARRHPAIQFRALALQSSGAEIVVGDLHDRRTLIPALEGVEVAYFTYPIAGGIPRPIWSRASTIASAWTSRFTSRRSAPRCASRSLSTIYFEKLTQERPMTLSEALSSGYLAFGHSKRRSETVNPS